MLFTLTPTPGVAPTGRLWRKRSLQNARMGHEEEYRIVMHSGFDMSTKDKRKLKYRFRDLAGIVFGARTDIEDKLKIMRLIDGKCAKRKRSDFKFFEIRYLHTESRFQLFPLDLLKTKYS